MVDTPSLLAELRTQGTRMAEVAATTSLDAPVPTCPDWVLRDLLLHTGGVHRWAETTVREQRASLIQLDEPYHIEDRVPGDDELVDWFRAGHSALVNTLEHAADDVACATFMRSSPTPKVFWTRRQAHETTVHRLDAEATAGVAGAVGTEFAADGIDELLAGFLPRNRRLRTENPRTLGFETTDTGDGWLVTVSAERPRMVRPTEREGPVDVRVRGRAEDLYRALWNRRDWTGMDITGDTDLLEHWSGSVRVTWS